MLLMIFISLWPNANMYISVGTVGVDIDFLVWQSGSLYNVEPFYYYMYVIFNTQSICMYMSVYFHIVPGL